MTSRFDWSKYRTGAASDHLAESIARAGAAAIKRVPQLEKRIAELERDAPSDPTPPDDGVIAL